MDSSARASRRALIPIGLAAAITSLDTTVVNNAVPVIRSDLHMSSSDVVWIATGYILSFASLLLVGGRLADIIGRRQILLAGLGIFASASVVVALSPGTGVLLAGRLLQGSGAAMIVPALLAIIAHDVPPRDRQTATALYTVAIAGSLAVGPFFGGAMAQWLHWTVIFWINVPIVAICAVVTLMCIPRTRAPRSIRTYTRQEITQRLDVPGLVWSGLMLACVTFALVEGPKPGFSRSLLLLVLAVAAAALVMAVRAERRAPFPLIDLVLVKHKVIAGNIGVQILWGMGINGVFFFTAIFLQSVLLFSPTASGLVFLPLALSLILCVPLSGFLAAKIGTHRTVGLGMFLVSAGLLTNVHIGRGDGMAQLLPGLLLLGVGSALITPMTTMALEAVPPSRAGVVSAVVSVAREVAGLLGIAATGAIVAVRQGHLEAAGVPGYLAFTSGYRFGMLGGAIAALVGGLIALRTLRSGQEMLPEMDLHATGTDDLAPELEVELDREPLRAPVAPGRRPSSVAAPNGRLRGGRHAAPTPPDEVPAPASEVSWRPRRGRHVMPTGPMDLAMIQAAARSDDEARSRAENAWRALPEPASAPPGPDDAEPDRDLSGTVVDLRDEQIDDELRRSWPNAPQTPDGIAVPTSGGRHRR